MVPGWLTELEAAELARLSANKTVLELGAWKGKSTLVFARYASYVVSVDRHEGIEEVGGWDSFGEYLANVADQKNVAVVRARFEDVVPLLGVFDLVYVDGDHSFDAVVRDGMLARDHGRVVAFHDWDLPDVPTAARLVFGRDPERVVGSVAVYEWT